MKFTRLRFSIAPRSGCGYGVVRAPIACERSQRRTTERWPEESYKPLLHPVGGRGLTRLGGRSET